MKLMNVVAFLSNSGISMCASNAQIGKVESNWVDGEHSIGTVSGTKGFAW